MPPLIFVSTPLWSGLVDSVEDQHGPPGLRPTVNLVLSSQEALSERTTSRVTAF
jgi:hypothetical protein